MHRLPALLMIVLLAGCAGTTSPSASVEASPAGMTESAEPSATATPTDAPVETDPPTPEPRPSVEPLPIDEELVAVGLAYVALTGDETGTSQVFVVDPDGTSRQLTGLSGQVVGGSGPVWSPDGTQLIFGPPKLGGTPEHQIWIINADGTGERVLAPLDEEFNVPFAWSPDGIYVAYGSIDAAEGPSLWLVEVSTGARTYLGVGQKPRWLPDGDRISYVTGVEGRVEEHPTALTQVVYLMALDGSAPQEFAEATDALWAPDGSAVLLPNEEEGEIYIANADGSGLELFAPGFNPAWSPDSTQIALVYDNNEEGLPLLQLVDRDGEVIWDDVVGQSPAWSPDGTRIAVEIPMLEPMVQVLDARNGEVLWEADGSQPDWGNGG